MTWTKHFREVPNAQKIKNYLNAGPKASGSRQTEDSWLPGIYNGPPNRLQRYKQYETMDSGSTVVSQSLDTIAEFCTQKEERSMSYFAFEFFEDASPSEVQILKEKRQTWENLNKFDRRLFKIFRNTLMYGDQVFIRDPETYRWLWVDQYNVDSVIVNDAKGKTPEIYWIKNLDLNLQTANITTPQNRLGFGFPNGTGMPSSYSGIPTGTTVMGKGEAAVSTPVDATHVIHLSLSEGLDADWPFGNSILKNVYKQYQQVALLEDAVIIYRLIRAPERRVFYIDVGNLPPNRQMAHLTRTKNEINQRKIPHTGQFGDSIVDGTINPMSMTEDYFFPQCLTLDTEIKLLDGRTLSLKQMIEEYEEGKELWVYSVNPDTHEIEKGAVKWAGVTRRDAALVEVTLDNGEVIRCTPDHRFILRDGSEKEAKDLTEDDLMTLEEDVKVSAVTVLDYTEDTGCITVESTSNSHNFALKAGIFVHNSADGRGSRVDTLGGGETLGQIDDLKWFNDQLKTGFNIPKSYIVSNSDEESGTYNDGRATTALISEFRFSKYCERLQALLNDVFDEEFKLYLKKEGINIDAGMFRITLNTPQNFAKYRQAELDNSLISTFGSIADMDMFSKRFLMKRFLRLTEDEIVENERLKKEEIGHGEISGAGDAGNDMRQVGVTPSFDMDDDFDDIDDDFDDDFGDDSYMGDAPDTGIDDAPPPPEE